eukprot:UN01770
MTLSNASVDICTGTSLMQQTYRSFLTDKDLKLLGNYQSPTSFIVTTEKTLKRWDILRMGTERLLINIMMRKIHEKLDNTHQEKMWSQQTKRKRGGETLVFSHPSTYITQIGDHIINVAEQLTPPEQEASPNNENEDPENSKIT